MAESLTLAEKLAYWRAGGLQISPRATPNRRNTTPPKVSDAANAWERGVPIDHRNMPVLDPISLQPLGQKRYAANRRQIEDARRRLAQPKADA